MGLCSQYRISGMLQYSCSGSMLYCLKQSSASHCTRYRSAMNRTAKQFVEQNLSLDEFVGFVVID